MATISTNDFKTGISIELSDGLFQVVKFQHVKPGKGGAFVRSTLKNLRTGAVVDRTFRAGEKVESAFISKREMQYLYRDPNGFTVMDLETFEQRSVSEAAMGDAANFLTEGSSIVLLTYGDEVVGTDLPASVELEVTETEPGVQGDRVSGARKPAVVETGFELQVPLFVNVGDRIKVDTRSGEYQTRA